MKRFTVAVGLVTVAIALGGAARAASGAAAGDAVRPAEADAVRGRAVADTSVDAACTRKVKVVYPGYGEAQRAECGTVTR